MLAPLCLCGLSRRGSEALARDRALSRGARDGLVSGTVRYLGFVTSSTVSLRNERELFVFELSLHCVEAVSNLFLCHVCAFL